MADLDPEAIRQGLLEGDPGLLAKYREFISQKKAADAQAQVEKTEIEKKKQRAAEAAQVRPFEYVAPQQPGVHPLDYLKQHVLGPDQWNEPTLDEVKNTIGDKGTKDALTEDSPLYHAYANARWAQEYDKAKAEGRSIQRTSRINPQTELAHRDLAQQRDEMETGALRSARSFNPFIPAALRAGESAQADVLEKLGDTAGAAEHRKHLLKMQRDLDTEPEGQKLLGDALISPFGIGRIAGPIAEAMGPARGVLSGALKGGASTALGGAAIGAADDLASGEKSPGEMASAAEHRLASPLSWAGGAGLGAVEGLTAGVRSGEALKKLQQVRAAGGAPEGLEGAVSGLSPGSTIEKYLREGERAPTSGEPVVSADEAAVNDVMGELMPRAKVYAEREFARFRRAQSKMYEFEQPPVPHTNTLKATIRYIKENTLPQEDAAVSELAGPEKSSMEAAPAPLLGRPVGRAKEVLNTLGKPKLMTKVRAQQDRIDPGLTMPLDEAVSKGFISQDELGKMGFPAGAPAKEYVLAYGARGLSAKQSDATIDELNRLTNVGKKTEGGADPFLESLHSAIRQDRENFKAPPGSSIAGQRATVDTPSGPKEVTGWAAWNHNVAPKLDEIKATLRRSGFQNPDQLTGSMTEDQVRNVLRSYRGKPEVEQALLKILGTEMPEEKSPFTEFAGESGKEGVKVFEPEENQENRAQQKLRAVAGTKAYGELKAATSQPFVSSALRSMEYPAGEFARSPTVRAALSSLGAEPPKKALEGGKQAFDQLVRSPSQSVIKWILANGGP